MTILYCQDSKGKIRTWEIQPDENGYSILYGLIGGEKIFHQVDVFPKANRQFDAQVELEIASKINKQHDKGYVHTLEQAKEGKTNAAGVIIPMKATPIDKIKNANYAGAMIQRKYNGHRCFMVSDSKGCITVYSHNGKLIDSVGHITQDMQLPPNVILDGELYVHGLSLQKISSYVRRKQEKSNQLKMVAFDTVADETYWKRYTTFKDWILGKNTIIAPAYSFSYSEEAALRYMRIFVDEGYEGAIIRLDNYNYEDGKRSKGLIKVKPKYDDEFVVVDIVPSKDGWARLVCKIPWISLVNTFKVVAPGTHEDKINIYINREEYIGRTIRVEYYDLTSDNVPFHPVALMWRNKDAE